MKMFKDGFDNCMTQTEPMKSGEMRPGREDKYDAPLAPSKILLDDINQTVVTWAGFLEPVDFGDCKYNYKLCEQRQRTRHGDALPYFTESSNDKYKESHHIT